eukprot:661463-Pleurochrysis_carterae.AAC.3
MRSCARASASRTTLATGTTTSASSTRKCPARGARSTLRATPMTGPSRFTVNSCARASGRDRPSSGSCGGQRFGRRRAQLSRAG